MYKFEEQCSAAQWLRFLTLTLVTGAEVSSWVCTFADGECSVGWQKKRFNLKGTLKASLKSFDIEINTWDKVAVCIPSNLAQSYPERLSDTSRRRTAGAKKKWELHKSRAASSSISGLIGSSLVCPTCGRSFKARIGLISHLRTHRSFCQGHHRLRWTNNSLQAGKLEKKKKKKKVF